MTEERAKSTEYTAWIHIPSRLSPTAAAQAVRLYNGPRHRVWAEKARAFTALNREGSGTFRKLFFFNEKEYTVERIDSVFSFCVVRREREGLVFSQRKQEQWIIFGRSSKVLQRFFGRSTERSVEALRAERFKKVKTEKRLSLPLQWWDHKTIWK